MVQGHFPRNLFCHGDAQPPLGLRRIPSRGRRSHPRHMMSVMRAPAGLRDFSQGHLVAQVLQGLHRALLLPFLLSRLEVIVPLLVIERPLTEEVVDNHQDLVGHRHRRFLPPEAPFETPKRLTQESRRFARGPGTWHQDAPQVPIPFAGATRAAFTGTFVIPRTHPSPGRQPGRRLKVAHLRADLRQDGPGRGRLDARDTDELLHLRCERCHELANMLVQVNDLLVQQIDEVSGSLNEPGMMFRTLSSQREFELGQLAS